MNFSFAIINLYSDGDTGADKVGSHEVERLLGRHCAPTFRGIKAGSLVAFSQTQMAALDQFLAVSREGLARGGSPSGCGGSDAGAFLPSVGACTAFAFAGSAAYPGEVWLSVDDVAGTAA